MTFHEKQSQAKGAIFESATAGKLRRKRRSGEDVARRIREAARELFGERGYGASTTKEIARRAEVSETLLFRYYGDKAGLFSEVVAAPFHQLIEQTDSFEIANPSLQSAKTQAEQLVEAVFQLLEENALLFRALLVETLVGDPARKAPEMVGLMPFFDSSIKQIQARYEKAGIAPPIDFEVGVRLGFAMIMSSVLMPEMLFSKPAEKDKVIHAVQFIVTRTMIGPDQA
jgi:AcrR family transcriptional regulator